MSVDGRKEGNGMEQNGNVVGAATGKSHGKWWWYESTGVRRNQSVKNNREWTPAIE